MNEGAAVEQAWDVERWRRVAEAAWNDVERWRRVAEEKQATCVSYGHEVKRLHGVLWRAEQEAEAQAKRIAQLEESLAYLDAERGAW